MELKYTLNRGKYKYATIKIDNSLQVTINVPKNFTDVDVEKLLTNKKDWIDKTIKKISERNRNKIVLSGNEILYLGEIYNYQQTVGMRKEVMINSIDKLIYASINLNDPKNLLRFYSNQAKFIIPNRISKLAAEHNIKFSSGLIRNTVSRYGSCSSKGVITLSTRLIMTPMFVIDAIVLHELSHIKVMNHSEKFYEELYRICPFYKQADSWLKSHMPVKYPPEKNL